ncbi:hypothetical protein [Leuconostoc gasicomitatum]|uniref:hypothetical protein n=1 Tax=Leuconostoc gasicomitatum TaxID=115778 RepID=UPI001CC59E67|nr:hypothetical protein [Leuconostoc gasicomitatum]MBZ5998544.1 hypothetical protein [Leuconostoc gasicomitatum]
MSLKIITSTTLSAQSVIAPTTEGQQPVVIAYFNATISDANSNTGMNIQNQDLYNASKAKVRADWQEFMTAVYEVEDTQASV